MYFLLLSVLIEVLLLLQTRTQPVHYQQVDSTTCLIFIQNLKNYVI